MTRALLLLAAAIIGLGTFITTSLTGWVLLP